MLGIDYALIRWWWRWSWVRRSRRDLVERIEEHGTTVRNFYDVAGPEFALPPYDWANIPHNHPRCLESRGENYLFLKIRNNRSLKDRHVWHVYATDS